MMKSLDEAINRFEKLASDYEFNLNMHKNHVMNLSVNDIERMKRNAQENRQLAEWLSELKELREFAHYVANSITAEEEEFDENPRFFGEVYCRKLHKLGIVKRVDNKWVYDEEVNADE